MGTRNRERERKARNRKRRKLKRIREKLEQWKKLWREQNELLRENILLLKAKRYQPIDETPVWTKVAGAIAGIVIVSFFLWLYG